MQLIVPIQRKDKNSCRLSYVKQENHSQDISFLWKLKVLRYLIC